MNLPLTMQDDPNAYAQAVLVARVATNFRQLVDNINELTRRLKEVNNESAELLQLSEYWQQYLENTQLVLQKLYEKSE